MYNYHLGDEGSVVVMGQITAKTANSEIWSLYKGSIIFHLITHDTDKNKSAWIFAQNKKLCCVKQYNKNNIKTKIS